MHLTSFATADDGRRFGCVIDENVIDFAGENAGVVWAKTAPRNASAAPPGSLMELLALGSLGLEWGGRFIEAVRSNGANEFVRPLKLVTLLPPASQSSQIFAIGRNYPEHVGEGGVEAPELPRLFCKWPSTLIGTLESIVKPALTKQLDWEVELAVVIGARADSVQPEHALEHVAGYTLLNDVSARDIQFSKPEQLTLAKNFRTFTPLGPWIVTLDELDDPNACVIKSWVNDELMQDGNTRDLIFSVPQLVSFLSHVLPLQPGDVISTGTPAGVGAFRQPPRYLEPGDRVRLELIGHCVLENPVTADPRAGPLLIR